ncbi:MAG: hypothetical protein R3D70_00835 [Rhizobiaceae bacterium]
MIPLANRISDALRNILPSSTVAAVLEDTDAALHQAKDKLARHRASALDPLADEKAVTIARKEIEERTFQIARLTEAKDRLHQRFDELLSSEQRAKEEAERQALEERQTLIREQFRMEYPLMANRIAALCQEMKAAGLSVHPNLRLPQIDLDAPAHLVSTGRYYHPVNEMASAYPAIDLKPDRSGRLQVVSEGTEPESVK